MNPASTAGWATKVVVPFLRLTRSFIAGLPGQDARIAVAIFDIVFNIIATVIGGSKYYTGAYAMFGISPASLLYNSPLLARDSNGGYTYPGHPVSITDMAFRLTSTTQSSERAGKWAAVMIPYREEHDKSHYNDVLSTLTFDDVVAMPTSCSGLTTQPLSLRHQMRDKSAYCARPRELTEEIAILFAIWQEPSHIKSSDNFTRSDFNCEVESLVGCKPHVLFGPRHRVPFTDNDFKLRSLTNGMTIRVHEGQDVTFQSYHGDSTMNEVMEGFEHI